MGQILRLTSLHSSTHAKQPPELSECSLANLAGSAVIPQRECAANLAGINLQERLGYIFRKED